MRRLLLTASLLLAAPVAAQERTAFRVSDFATGLERPWGGAFLPDGRLGDGAAGADALGRARRPTVRAAGRRAGGGSARPGRPARPRAGAGLRADAGAVLIPIPCCWRTAPRRGWCGRGSPRTAQGLQAVTPILDATPAQASGRNHYGCRIAFGPDGALFLPPATVTTPRARAAPRRPGRQGAASFARRRAFRRQSLCPPGRRAPGDLDARPPQRPGPRLQPAHRQPVGSGVRRPRRRRGEPAPTRP